MKFVTVVCAFTTLLYGISAEVCQSTNDGTACLTEDDMPSWAGGMMNGETCFSYNGADWCFISTGGNMHPCECFDDSVTYDNPYCNPINYGDDQHTMCIYEGEGSSCGSSGTISSGIDAAGITALVDKHNELRALVASGGESQGVGGGQPSAANMIKVVWSDELAEIAQRWADQCTSGHDTNRNTETYSWVGQNYAMKASSAEFSSALTSAEWGDMVQMWYDEVKDMPASCVGTFDSNCGTGTIGHYTQVVWAESTEIGCGFVHFLDPAPTWNAAYPYTRELICNYGPGGNFGTGPVYIEGTAGSQCPSGSTCV